MPIFAPDDTPQPPAANRFGSAFNFPVGRAGGADTIYINIRHFVALERQMGNIDASYSDINIGIWMTLITNIIFWFIGLIPFIYTAKSTLIRSTPAIKRIAQKLQWVKWLKLFGIAHFGISMVIFYLIWESGIGPIMGSEFRFSLILFISPWLIRAVYCFLTSAWLAHQFRR